MKKCIKFLVIPFSILLFSVSTYGSTELGEYCFSGHFIDEGNCVARLEITQHIVNYSIHGRVNCERTFEKLPDGSTNSEFYNDSISGIANGTGFIEGDNFVGALTITLKNGEAGVSQSWLRSTLVDLKVNLSNLEAQFGRQSAPKNCTSTAPNQFCLEGAIFSSIACPK